MLGAGIALGVAGDLLLRKTPWGLNWALWAACLVIAAVVATLIARFEAPRAWPWLLAVAVLLSGCLAWRASPMLAALNLAAAGAAAAVATGALRGGVTSYAMSGAKLAAETLAGPFPAGAGIEWSDMPKTLIARTNIDRHVEGRHQLDTYYLGHLSADATPTILSRLDDVPSSRRKYLVSELAGEVDDWRTWNWSRSRAQDALDDYARSVAAASR